MKIAELKKTAAPSGGSASEVGPVPDTKEGTQAEPQFTTATTPSGVEILYQWAPRRLYRLNGTEVPSVTTVLNVLDKSGPLTWWAQGIGAQGVLELHRQQAVDWENMPTKVLINTEEDPLQPPIWERLEATKETVTKAIVQRRLSVNHVKDSAADRGVNVHGALERWVDGEDIEPNDYPDHEREYVIGLAAFLDATRPAAGNWQTELMVGSLQHQYAGRFDLVLTLSKPVEVVTRCYPKKPSKVEEIPAGRYLLDLKTSKRVYDSHFLQLEAYEAAAVECGYAPTDHRGVVHVTADGKYELVLNKDWCLEDFLAVRKVYQVMNEREALRILREELNATEVPGGTESGVKK